jgi:hypothetical protein
MNDMENNCSPAASCSSLLPTAFCFADENECDNKPSPARNLKKKFASDLLAVRAAIERETG